MFRRTAVLIATVASLLLSTVPALAADVYRVGLQGTGIQATFTNFPGESETLPAGDYFFTEVLASDVVLTGTGEPYYDYVCVYHSSFTIDENGEWFGKDGVFACGPVDTLTVDRRLTTGRLIATIPVSDCAVWDEEMHECLEWIELGNVEVDLTLAGSGPVERQRGASTGGTAGSSTYVIRGTASLRHAAPSGVITFDGASLIEGAASTDGLLVNVSEGSIEISVGG